MDNDSKKIKGKVPVIGFWGFLIIVTLCVLVLCYIKKPKSTEGKVYVFDGWVYGVEDQKKACSALATAGLEDYAWDSGKLCVPSTSKNAYQTALASAGAYPKAPSDSRGEAIRQMSPFESASKSRMREQDARALQLERTIEQMRGVEYATVGFCSRRETVGLVAKNIVTATIGIATKDDSTLDRNLLTAVTVASQRLLGIEDEKAVAIIDLKEGKSYLGLENAKEQVNDLVVEETRERIEKYWRNKYIDAFSDIKNIRVSVEADLITSVDASLDPETELDEGRDSETQLSSDSRILPSSFRRRTEISNDFSDENENSLRNSGGFAQLGTPQNKGRSFTTVNAKIDAESLTQLRSGRPSRVFRRAFEDPQTTVDNLTLLSRYDATNFELSYMNNRSSDSSDFVVCNGVSLKNNVLGSIMEPLDFESSFEFQNLSCSNSHGRVRGPIRPASALEPSYDEKSFVQGASYKLRSILIHINLPRSYIVRVAQAEAGFNSTKSTFANASEWDAVYRSTEEKLILETKKYAITLFRPTGDRLGWSDSILQRSIIVDVYSDAEKILAEEWESGDSGNEENQTVVNYGVGRVSSERDVFENTVGNISLNQAQSITLDASTEHNKEAPTSSRGTLASTSGKVAEISTESSEEIHSTDDDVCSELVGENVREFWAYLSKLSLGKIQGSQRWLLTGGASCLSLLLILFLFKSLFSRRVKKDKTSKNVAALDADVSLSKRKSEDKRVKTSTNLGRRFDSSTEDDFDDELASFVSGLDSANGSSYRLSQVNNETFPHRERMDESFSTKRREALDLISRYPERAAASLRSWLQEGDA